MGRPANSMGGEGMSESDSNGRPTRSLAYDTERMYQEWYAAAKREESLGLAQMRPVDSAPRIQRVGNRVSLVRR